MGGGGNPAPQVIGGDPIPVPKFGDAVALPAPSGYQPPSSTKGGTLAGLPTLNELFNRPLGGPSPFTNSMSFPKPGFGAGGARGGTGTQPDVGLPYFPGPTMPGTLPPPGGRLPGQVTTPVERDYQGR